MAPKKRGGRRPGAGAPKGNTNALKHGRYSQQFNRIGRLLASEPRTRATLMALAERFELGEERTHEVTARLLTKLVDNVRAQSRNPRNRRGSPGLSGAEGSNPALPTLDADSISAATAEVAQARHEIEAHLAQNPEKAKTPDRINQNSDTTGGKTIQPQIRNKLD